MSHWQLIMGAQYLCFEEILGREQPEHVALILLSSHLPLHEAWTRGGRLVVDTGRGLRFYFKSRSRIWYYMGGMQVPLVEMRSYLSLRTEKSRILHLPDWSVDMIPFNKCCISQFYWEYLPGPVDPRGHEWGSYELLPSLR